jgi:hypothetical protein
MPHNLLTVDRGTSVECDVEALDDSAELVAQLKELALDDLRAFELGEELEGGFARVLSTRRTPLTP